MKDLQLYTASAGAGKTYRLALAYIHQLFEFPDAYRRILAVTFTNKAAAEMKKRILEKLNQLSKKDSAASDYARYLMDNNLARSEDEISSKARALLITILHDYSAFYVQTIDRFFQWVIRGFTREIGLQNGYNLELDNNSVLTEAVDMLIYGMEEDVQLKDWLIEFAEEKINEGKSWDFNNDVFQLGKEVFKENYQSVIDETSDLEKRKEKFNSLRKQLNTTLFSIENEVRKKGLEGLDMIKKSGLEIPDFKNGNRGVASLFEKAVKKSLTDLNISDTNRRGADDFSIWVTKDSPNKEKIRELYEGGLNQLLTDIIKIYDEQYHKYVTAFLLKKNIYSFGILNDISDRIREITREKNLFLLSDSSLFLKKIIGENDAPFIFEKAGNYFSNYMLDEFQDTSRFQWDNFLPLIENGLATGNTSVVVGDVKQSIYRWRNSDWKILASELKERISLSRIDDIKLDTNYRSSKNIVSFNNSVFYNAPGVLKDLIRKELSNKETPEYMNYWFNLIDNVYGEPRQKFSGNPKNYPGHISHSFSEYLKKEEKIGLIDSWIISRVKELQDRGYSAGDITFLVRTSREGREIARILMEEGARNDPKYNFSVISNDSLYLENHSTVRFLIALLRFFNQPHDLLNTSFIKHEYLAYLADYPEAVIDLHEVFTSAAIRSNKTDSNPCFEEFARQHTHLHRLPLYELVEGLILIFRLNSGEERIAYLQAFQDQVLEFVRKERSDISSFLNYWDSSGRSSTLNVSESQDALRIMTIHKAKGLEFKVVLIPFCDWKLYPEVSGLRSNVLWPETAQAGYDEFSHLPVLYSSQMKNSMFWKEYYEEMFRTFVDNLNLLYVAFTRAELELHSFSFLSKDPENITSIADLIWDILNKSRPAEKHPDYLMADLAGSLNTKKGIFSYGTPSAKPVAMSKKDGVVTEILSEYQVFTKTKALNLNHKNIYLSGLKEDEKGKTGYGTQMHEIFAEIDTLNDLDSALRNAWLKGLLSGKDRENLEIEIKDKLSRKPFTVWFSGEWKSKREMDLTEGKGNILRPDRVMMKENELIILDYKFGKEKKHHYTLQLKEYAKALEKSGYEYIRMFLWYYNLDELEEVYR
jgi:ATP-dependent exoDNAse (exonuclease V) beta subunit